MNDDYVVYRFVEIENKIQECVDRLRSGEQEVSIDCGDLSDEEIAYIQEEVRKKISGTKI